MPQNTPQPNPKNRRESGQPSRWDQYVELLDRKKVPEKARRWYVARVEAFLRQIKPDSLQNLSADEATGFFQEVSRSGNLADWQFRQTVDAIQILLVDLANAPVGGKVDWDYWREAARELGADHATVARDQPLGEGLASGGPKFAPSAQTMPLLKDLARKVRSKQHSIEPDCYAGLKRSKGFRVRVNFLLCFYFYHFKLNGVCTEILLMRPHNTTKCRSRLLKVTLFF